MAVQFDIRIGIDISARGVNVRIAERQAADGVDTNVEQRQEKRQDKDEVVPLQDPLNCHGVVPCS